MIKIIYILLLLVAPFSLFAQKRIEPKSTTITGRVINMTATDPAVITFNYVDPISNVNRKALRLPQSGEFISKFDMHFSQNITVKFNDEFINVFINLNDSIDITIDMNKFREGDYDGVIFSGDGAEINNQFSRFNNFLLSVTSKKLNLNLPAKEFLVEIKSALSELEDSISVYAKKNSLNPFIVKWAKRDIVYSLANRILDYSRSDNKQRLEVLLDPIFDINNADNFKSMMFQVYLHNTLSPILKQDEVFLKFMKSGDMENGTLAGVNALMQLPTSTSRDYLLYLLAVEVIQSSPQFYDKLPKDIFLNSIFDERLRNMSQKYTATDIKLIPISGIAYLKGDSVQSLAEVDIFGYLSKRYRNKVIYLDIWSTSCGPCIAQFKDAKELHKLYANDDIVFVNICLTSTLKNWVSIIDSKKVGGENYYIDNDNSALFMDMCKIQGYPTYMLMDKSGKLVNKNAPQPQNISRISELIDELLNSR